MTILTSAEDDRSEIARAFADPSRLTVVSLCAAWCYTCDEFRATYERLALVRPRVAFVWLDIEDDAAAAGDIDVENFPTLAIYRGGVPVHFGVSLPHEAIVCRLIDALADDAPTLRDVPEALLRLPEQLSGR